ncbi:MAG: hypothetical protein ACXAC2_14720 [Candidatus Kariarchaeaceae archaeon]|jgi:hypothetical protein
MYKVLASLRSEMNEGWVWLNNMDLEPRSIVKITNRTNGKKIYCECLEIDKNFLKEYNQPYRITINDTDKVIVINEWYRKQLGGLNTKQEYDLEIRAANNMWGRLWTNFYHPQVVVRLATKLAILSVILGVVSILISLCA